MNSNLPPGIGSDMNRAFERKLTAGAALISAVIGLATLLTWRSGVELQRTLRMMAHAHEVIEVIQEVLRFNAEGETATRGFIITGQDAFADAYRSARAGSEKQLQRLNELTGENPIERQHVAVLGKLAARHFEWQERLLRTAQTETLAAARQLVAGGEGTRRLETIRRTAAEVQAEAERVLHAGQGSSASSDRQAKAMLAALAVLIPASVLGPWFLVRRHLGARTRAEEHTVRLNETLEQRVAERTAQLEATIGQVRETTASQREAEEAARRSEEKIRVVLDSLAEGVVFLNASGAVERMNRAAPHMLGRTQQELEDPLLTPGSILVRGDGTPFPVEEQPGIVALREGRTVRNVEVGVQRPEGDVRWIAVSAQPVRDRAGNITGAVASFFEITERKRAEDALRLSEERFAKIFQSSPDAIVLSRASDSRIVDVNDAWTGLFGLSREEVLGRTGGELNLIANPADREEAVRRLGEPGGLRDFRLDIRRKSGELRHALLSTQAIVVGGEPYLLTILHDITAAQEAQDALHVANEHLAKALDASRDAQNQLYESQQRLVLALDTAQIGEWELDLLSGAASRTRRHDQIFGYEEGLQEWDFQIFLQHVHRDDRTRVNDSFQAGVAAGEWNFECRFRRADGAMRWMWARGGVLKDSAGRAARMVGMVADITEIRHAAEALRESEAMTRMIVENALDGVVSIDQRGVIIGWNGQAEAMFGWSQAEAMGQPLAELIIPEHYRAVLQRFLATGEAPVLHRRIELTALRRDGEGFPVEVSISSMTRAGDVVFSAFIRDITERKRADEEIRSLNAELERRVEARTRDLEAANRELETFSYSVSHDLRAPLRHIQGYVEMLQRSADGHLPDKSRRYLATISDSSREMGVLIDDLLSFSRMSRAEMRPEPVDLNELVPKCVEMFDTALSGRRVQWSMPELPRVMGDGAMLKQVIVNLLDNAIKYTRPRELAEIEIGSGGVEDGRVILYVRDNGVGFDPAYSHKLFGVFQRLHRSDEFEGTGIGLANIRRIIGRHGGRTWAEGNLNEGATIYFTLPAETTESEERGS